MEPLSREVGTLGLSDVESVVRVVGSVVAVGKPVPRPTLAAFSCHQCRNETLAPQLLSDEHPRMPERCPVEEGGCGALFRVVGTDYVALHSILTTVQEIRLRTSVRSPRVVAVLIDALIGKASRRMRVQLRGKVVLRERTPKSDGDRPTLVILVEDIQPAIPGPLPP